jgi:ubiquinone/menaquinone biosynthesis C-methylase UbiE
MTTPIDLQPTGDLPTTRAYYDEFAARYDDKRGGREPNGYHDLVDDLEVDYAERFGRGLDVLEVGCGTGLILARIAGFARTARGIDLSPGMLERARARGLDVMEGSATKLPFDDASFDVVCSFKVLAHVREIELALREMARVTRPGGTVLAEFYNPLSLRGLVKAPRARSARAPRKMRSSRASTRRGACASTCRRSSGSSARVACAS